MLDPLCMVCENLELRQTSISPDSLCVSAAAGCDLCSIICDGIRNFKASFEDVHRLEFLVDFSLYVYIIDKKKKVEKVIEFYTEAGREAPLSKCLLTSFHE